MTQAFVRFGISSVVLYGMVRFLEPNAKLKKEDLPRMILAGVIGITLYFYFENNGVMLISASSASLIIATIPIFTMVADFFVFKSPMTKRKIISVLFSMIGVYFIVGTSHGEIDSSEAWIGYGMMFGAAIAWVFYTIVTKTLFDRYSELTIVYYQSLFGTIALLPFIFFERINWEAMTGSIVLNMLFLAVFCSALATYFYVYALDAIGASLCSLLMNLIPVVTIIASYFLLKEKITLFQILGGVLVIAAVYICNKEKEAETIHHKTAA